MWIQATLQKNRRKINKRMLGTNAYGDLLSQTGDANVFHRIGDLPISIPSAPRKFVEKLERMRVTAGVGVLCALE